MVRLKIVINGIFACRAAVLLRGNQIADGQHQDRNSLRSFVSSEVVATLETVASVLMDPVVGEQNSVDAAVSAASKQMDLKSAVSLMDKKTLPEEVSNLVAKVQTGTFGEFSEESLAKARRALNTLVEKAWIELDDKIFKCKGFQEMNRENYAQSTRDTLRLIEQVSDMSRIEQGAIEGATGKEQEIIDVEATLAEETKLYNIEFDQNKAELTIRQNDMDVFQFVVVFTKCPDATSLSQTGVKVCEYRNGPQAGHKTITFADQSAASKYEEMLTPNVRTSIDRLLRSIEHGSQSLLQQPQGGNVSTTPQPKPSAPVKGAEGKECGGIDPCMTCGPDPPDCALLHDKLSLMWGEFKDKVDELTMTMAKNTVDFEDIKENLNAQIRMLVASKARFSVLLSEARSNLAADRAEMKEKLKQKRNLDRQYEQYMTRCKKDIAFIMGQSLCAIKTVRNAVLENSTDCPTEKIQDCSMDDWVPEACSVSCDDSCDPSQPFKCGGWQRLSRKTVVANDECGIKCPVALKNKRCGQYHCPIDCHMSSWSGWSKCTADCEGGLQSHTRSIRVKPKNGGEQCNTVEESRPCNTQTCDRDCRLQRWTKWTPCSVACGGGFMEKFRHVLIPTRGEGRCAKATSPWRYSKTMCNEQACNGDEICVAKQDLIIAIDSSGSVQEKGFKVLTGWVAVLLKRYMSEYFGEEAVKMGIVLFGNGVIMPDGTTVSPAISAQKLTFDLEAVQTAVGALPFKKGFTNMAQAFAMAEDMFSKGLRTYASQSLMVVTDGKPSFSFMTAEMVQQLDDKSIMRHFVVISEAELGSPELKNMKIWASQPWETNIVHIKGGLLMLEADPELWAERATTKFCPQAISPSAMVYDAQLYGYEHVKDSGWCGENSPGNILGKDVADAEQCAALAAGADAGSFLFGVWFKRGWCIQGTADVDSKVYREWQNNKVNPDCNSGWKSSMLYDFYAMKPVNYDESVSS